jgi:hypothetical protein
MMLRLDNENRDKYLHQLKNNSIFFIKKRFLKSLNQE